MARRENIINDDNQLGVFKLVQEDHSPGCLIHYCEFGRKAEFRVAQRSSLTSELWCDVLLKRATILAFARLPQLAHLESSRELSDSGWAGPGLDETRDSPPALLRAPPCFRTMSWKETPFQIPKGRGDGQQRHGRDRCECQQGRRFPIGSQTMKSMTLENLGILVCMWCLTRLWGMNLNRPNKHSLWPRYVCAQTEPQACKIAYEVFHYHVGLAIQRWRAS